MPRLLAIVRPHANDFHNFLRRVNLIDESALDIDPPGIRTFQFTDQCFLSRWLFEGILFKNFKKTHCLFLQIAAYNLFGTILRLLSKDQLECYHPAES